MIHFVCATPLNVVEFANESTLLDYCVALRALNADMAHFDIAADNRHGLGKVYNSALSKLYAQRIVDSDFIVFLHDDVTIEDINLPRKLQESAFDVVGLAGTTKLLFESPVLWNHARLGEHTLSGAVAHANGTDIWMNSYGTFRKPCEVVDGLFIAVRLKRLIESGVRFDEQFDFHFYDLDFCLSARKAGLTIGTEPIWVVHRGLGDWDTQSWHENERRFLEKWGAR